PPMYGFVGLLDADGTAAATIAIGPGEFVGLAGIQLHHAFVTGPGFAIFASNPVPLKLVP
ncbi:MAG: hypothetical protein O7A09_00860, partial [Proteobacteria bacterium]|nr:hypothetical protein [Pseudomonadota bacterium]